MGMEYSADELIRQVSVASTADELHSALSLASASLGFRYFALTRHVDVSRGATAESRFHNYPDAWAEYYDRAALGAVDPVHRASHTTSLGFVWSDIASMIRLREADRAIIALGQAQGLGQGFTVPANIPGELLGSCSFATGSDAALDRAALPVAQLVGLTAFEAARRIRTVRRIAPGVARLTDRERDCLLWVARGKGDWEIARILGISQETVDRHLKNARERYGVVKRTSVVVHALFDGTLSFSEVFER